MSSSWASGTKSLMSGARFSVRLPSRIVAIWVSDPIGFECPRRMLSTPAMNVVATAPRPGVMIPSLPVAGRGVDGASEPEPCTYDSPYVRLASGAATCPEARPCLGLGERLGFIRSSGGGIHERHPLDHGDPGRQCQDDGDHREHPPVEHQTEEG